MPVGKRCAAASESERERERERRQLLAKYRGVGIAREKDGAECGI